MHERSAKGYNPRALAAATALASGLVTALTGLWLSQTRQACQLRHIHLATALVFTAAVIWHGTFNLKPLTSYLLTRDGGGQLRAEARTALVITVLAVLLGLLWTPSRWR